MPVAICFPLSPFPFPVPSLPRVTTFHHTLAMCNFPYFTWRQISKRQVVSRTVRKLSELWNLPEIAELQRSVLVEEDVGRL